MSVFFEVISRFVTKDLKRIKNTAIQKNGGMLVSLGVRDTEVSDLKQDKIQIFSDKIKKIDLKVFNTDTARKDEIKRLLTECKLETNQIGIERIGDKGTTGSSIDKINTFVDDIFFIFNKNKLLDISHDNDALNILIYHLMMYVAEYCFENRGKESITSRIGSWTAGFWTEPDKIALSSEKKEAALTCIAEARQMLLKLDTRQQDYLANRTLCMQDRLVILNAKNAELCDDSTVGISTPLMLSVPGISLKTTFKPSPGVLGDTIDRALQEISENCTKQKTLAKEITAKDKKLETSNSTVDNKTNAGTDDSQEKDKKVATPGSGELEISKKDNVEQEDETLQETTGLVL